MLRRASLIDGGCSATRDSGKIHSPCHDFGVGEVHPTISTHSRPACRLSAAFAAFAATLSLLGAKAELEVTLQLAPAMTRETRIHLLSVGAPERAAAELARLDQEFPLRVTIER